MAVIKNSPKNIKPVTISPNTKYCNFPTLINNSVNLRPASFFSMTAILFTLGEYTEDIAVEKAVYNELICAPTP